MKIAGVSLIPAAITDQRALEPCGAGRHEVGENGHGEQQVDLAEAKFAAHRLQPDGGGRRSQRQPCGVAPASQDGAGGNRRAR